MDDLDTHMIINAIKSARSPNMALNGAKLLYGKDAKFGEIFKVCFDMAWSDASRFNQYIEENAGIPRRPDRLSLDEQDVTDAVEMIARSRNPARELGRCLAEYDEQAIKDIFRKLPSMTKVL